MIKQINELVVFSKRLLLSGIKLHLQVAHALGFVGIKYINTLQSISSRLPAVELTELLVTATAVALPLIGLGTTTSRKVAAHCFSILAVPITVAYKIMALLYRLHLNATKQTWLAMRGKTRPLQLFSFFQKENMGIPSKGEKSLSSAPQPLYPTQLAVASLLFMPCILTFPTTAWFYAFSSVVELVCYGVPMITLSLFTGSSIDPDNIVNLLHKWAQGHVLPLK